VTEIQRIRFAQAQAALKVAFEACTKERHKRRGLVHDPERGRDEFEWVVFERRAMWVAVNLFRASNGLPAVKMSDILRVENTACGHSDYYRKFPLYCAELAVGVSS
jgi:hypothetical protein